MTNRTRDSFQKNNADRSHGPSRRGVALALALLAVAVACEQPEAKKAAEPPAPAVAQPTLPLAQKPGALGDTKTEAAPTKATRPSKVDFALTDERRAEVEKAYPDAKGFLVATTIEENLKAKKVTSEAPAIKAFDAAAKGKWVLFSGTMVNLTEDGFDLGVTYTPQLPGDVMGMSRQWFPITFSEIEGYDKSKFKLGNSVVVLAKYAGGKKASSGYELVDQQHWK